MAISPFAPLAAALLLFLLSTRQWRLRWRAPIWIAGAVGLGAAFALAFSAPSVGPTSAILQALIDGYGFDVLARAFAGNSRTVGEALAPMFAMFAIAAALVGLVCLVAFTPGERVEKAVRPVNIALLGAIAGGLGALVVVGLGLGGAAKREVYVAIPSAADIVDGDTFRVGDVSLRLWGIDAPEMKQVCRDRQAAPYDCGAVARQGLSSLIAGRLLTCAKPNAAAGQLRESFGRPLVACWIQENGRRIDIAERMAADGLALVFTDNGVEKTSSQTRLAAEEAERRHIGIHAGTFIHPELWRNGVRWPPET